MSTTIEISSKEQFDNVVKSTNLVIANFYVESSSLYKHIEPVFERLSAARSLPSSITFVKVNAEQQKDIATQHNVSESDLPIFIVFRQGVLLDRVRAADMSKVQQLDEIFNKLTARLRTTSGGESSGGDSSGSTSTWRGAELPRGYRDVTDQIELPRCELLNVSPDAGSLRVLFSAEKPGALGGGKKVETDWVESETDGDLLLFLHFQSRIKLHTLQLTSVPPEDDDEDDVPIRPTLVKLFSNTTHNLTFEDAQADNATQEFQLTDRDWKSNGTAAIGLRFVNFQNINSLVIFVQTSDGGESGRVRLDRIRLIGETGEKREMGKLEKVGAGE